MPFSAIASIYFRQGKLDKGRKYSIKALSILPNDSVSAGTLGFHLTKASKYKEATFWLETYLVLDPTTRYRNTALKMIQKNKEILRLSE